MIDPQDDPQAAFGAEVQRFRERLGLSQREFAQRARLARPTVSRLETGAIPPTLRTARRIDGAFDTQGKFETLLAGDTELGFLYGGYVPIEQEKAVGLEQWQPLVIPALLQTRLYARHTLEVAIPRLSPARIKKLTGMRLDRQQALTRTDPPPLEAHFVIAEGALTQLVGGRDVMLQQWQHLLACMERPNVTVQVLPAHRGAHSSMRGAYTILETQPAGWAVYVETIVGGEVLTQQKVITETRQRFRALATAALPVTDSTACIRALIS